jgi:hypothetical protein
MLFLSRSSGVWHLALNGLNAFGLNFAVYLLIGRTSALTMNVSGELRGQGRGRLSVPTLVPLSASCSSPPPHFTHTFTHSTPGLIKDWFTISGSVIFLGSIVTLQNLIGFSIAFVGVIWYNYLRLSHPPGGRDDWGQEGGLKGSDGIASIEVEGGRAGGGGERGEEEL